MTERVLGLLALLVLSLLLGVAIVPFLPDQVLNQRGMALKCAVRPC